MHESGGRKLAHTLSILRRLQNNQDKTKAEEDLKRFSLHSVPRYPHLFIYWHLSFHQNLPYI